VGVATPSIDGFYAVTSILGERFTYYRLAETSEDDKAEKALIHAGHESQRLNGSVMVCLTPRPVASSG
jgi:hypothetical protein